MQIEQRLAALFRDSPLGVAVVDESERVVECSEALSQLLGQRVSELRGRCLADFRHPDDAIPDASGPAELRYLRSDGELRHVRESSVPLAEGEQEPPLRVHVLEDLTALRDAREESLRLRAELQGADDERLRALRQLAGGIAHDLNNMLAVILAGAEAAHPTQRDPLSEAELTAALDDIRWAALRSRDLVSQILAFAGHGRLSRSAVSLAHVVAGALDKLSDGAGSVAFRSASEDELPVHVDGSLIEQVVTILVRNAIEAMEPAGGEVAVSLERIAGSDLQPPRACLAVRDTGCGMDEALRRRIFEPFFTTRSWQGATGMGLSTALGIVEAHGGRIEVESEPGSGTSVFVFLPLLESGDRDAETTTALREPAADAAPSREPAAASRVLLVDDEPLVLRSTGRILRHIGCEVTLCSGAEEALDLLRGTPHAFDAVLTDYRMPGIDGADLAQRIAALVPGLPVLLMTGNREAIDPVVLQQGSVHDVLPKPIPSEELARALERLR